jgi:mono/diheme cytochrome c family protein
MILTQYLKYIPLINKSRLIAIILISFTSCDSGIKEENVSLSEKSNKDTTLNNLSLKGELLFKAQCSMCHNKDTIQKVGPGLAGITKRQNKEEIRLWIINSQKRIESGDIYAGNLFLKYNKIPMPSFSLSDKEIDAVLFYIDSVK